MTGLYTRYTLHGGRQLRISQTTSKQRDSGIESPVTWPRRHIRYDFARSDSIVVIDENGQLFTSFAVCVSRVMTSKYEFDGYDAGDAHNRRVTLSRRACIYPVRVPARRNVGTASR